MLYPVLHRLEDNDLIKSYWEKSKTGRRRKYYYLKEKGLLELENHKRQWEIVHSILSAEIYNNEKEGGK